MIPVQRRVAVVAPDIDVCLALDESPDDVASARAAELVRGEHHTKPADCKHTLMLHNHSRISPLCGAWMPLCEEHINHMQ
jgi:hypothetical protein